MNVAFVSVIGILTLVFLALLTLAGMIGSILYLSGRPQTGVRRVGGSIALVCGTVLVGLLLLAVMLAGFRDLTAHQANTDAVRRAQQEAEQIQRRYTTPPPVPALPPIVGPPVRPLTTGRINPFAWAFLGLLFAPSVVGSILFLAGRRNSGVRRVGGAMVLVSVGVLLPLMGLGFFVGWARSGSEFATEVVVRDHVRKMEDRLHQEHLEVPQPAPTIVIHADAEANVDAGLKRLPEAQSVENPADALQAKPVPDATAAATSPEIPAWVTAGSSKNGDVQHHVVSSQQYATRDEARQDLARKAGELLSQDYRDVYRESASALKNLSPLEVRQLAVHQPEHFEETKTDFGSFTAPMYRGYWQVELSPRVRVNLRQLEKAQVQEFRVLTVGGTLAGITVILAGLSLLTRRRHAVMAA